MKLDNYSKIRIIRNWTHKFDTAGGIDRWHARIQYKPDTIMHSSLYFNYDEMINVTYRLMESRVWGVIQNYLENGR